MKFSKVGFFPPKIVLDNGECRDQQCKMHIGTKHVIQIGEASPVFLL